MRKLYLYLVWTIAMTVFVGGAGAVVMKRDYDADQTATLAYSPPEWQTAICFPDDPYKTLVDKTGKLLYHYKKGGREFGTKVSLDILDRETTWISQKLVDPQAAIVRTRKSASGIELTEDAFAVPEDIAGGPVRIERLDGQTRMLDWSKPVNADIHSMRDIELHFDGSIEMALHVKPGSEYRLALVLCEGHWKEPEQRIQVLGVEGSDPVTVDMVAQHGHNTAEVFWFDGRDSDGDGRIMVRVSPASTTKDRNMILNGLWVFDSGVSEDSEALLKGMISPGALASLESIATRKDMILMHITNTAATEASVTPVLVVDSAVGASVDLAQQRVVVRGHESVRCSLPMRSFSANADGSISRITLETILVPPKGTASVAVSYDNRVQVEPEKLTLDAANRFRDNADDYWRNANLPYGRIVVPDTTIQGLLDSSIRNIWQAREIKNGLPAFQVGPTVYRGLWIVDGAFILEAATLVGAAQEARSGIAYVLTHQRGDGGIYLMRNYTKENGIVLWTCWRHAQLTQDREWLEGVWGQLTGIAQHVRALRRETLANDEPLDDGLMPPGFPDGGIGGVIPEYTNPYWNLAGLHAFIRAARWLGKTEVAEEWQTEYDSFFAAFQAAARRDMKTDPYGNPYLPIRMDGADYPQRGQWAFCHAVYPGEVFGPEDALVAGNLAMLEETLHEGLVLGTGWDASGLWNYFASFYGHALLWTGKGGKAANQLYAMATHASPTMVWREEQSLRGQPFHKVGDMPHNWASAEFIRLTVHLLALARGRELHLFEGLPETWLQPKMLTKLDGVATQFGPLSMTLRIAEDGRMAELKIDALTAKECENIVVHLGACGSAHGPGRMLKLDPSEIHAITLKVDNENGKRILRQ